MDLTEDMLLVVHVPKTAGTSLRQGLEKSFGLKNVVRDYGPHAEETTNIVHEYLYCKESKCPKLLVKAADALDAKILIGHFDAKKYSDFFAPENIITFVREPLERTCSEYLHRIRQSKFSGSFSDYIEGQNVINSQSRLLYGLPEGSFIGVTEHYREALRYLNNRHNLKVRLLKKNTDRQGGGARLSKNLAQADVDRFYELNKLDVTLYSKCLKNFSELEIPSTKVAQLLRYIGKPQTK